MLLAILTSPLKEHWSQLQPPYSARPMQSYNKVFSRPRHIQGKEYCWYKSIFIQVYRSGNVNRSAYRNQPHPGPHPTSILIGRDVVTSLYKARTTSVDSLDSLISMQPMSVLGYFFFSCMYLNETKLLLVKYDGLQKMFST